MLGLCVAFHHDNNARNTVKVQCPLFACPNVPFLRSYEGATSIVHGSNIVTPPKETGGKQGKQTVS